MYPIKRAMGEIRLKLDEQFGGWRASEGATVFSRRPEHTADRWRRRAAPTHHPSWRPQDTLYRSFHKLRRIYYLPTFPVRFNEPRHGCRNRAPPLDCAEHRLAISRLVDALLRVLGRRTGASHAGRQAEFERGSQNDLGVGESSSIPGGREYRRSSSYLLRVPGTGRASDRSHSSAHGAIASVRYEDLKTLGATLKPGSPFHLHWLIIGHREK